MKTEMLQRYSAVVSFSEEDGGYLARIPAFRYCTGFGDTPEDAIKEAYDGLAGIVEVMNQDGVELPEPESIVCELRTLKPILKITQLANLAGMKPSTLSSKIDRGGPFDAEESARLKSVLSYSVGRSRELRSPSSSQKKKKRSKGGSKLIKKL